MPSTTNSPIPANLIPALRTSLDHISQRECPHVAGPPDVSRRASVALIIRVQPSYGYWPDPTQHSASFASLDAYFAQDWVQHGDPEAFFIKRAARKGDRWTSHVALPGGKREIDLEDDRQAAIRETHEEVGIDLANEAIYVGNLPQRVVKTQWGTVPLMVLCPFVFLLKAHHTALRVQPTEVASAHWVRLRDLLVPDHRTLWYEDVSNRLAKQQSGLRRSVLRAMVGKMTFAAVQLHPTETVTSFESPGAMPAMSGDDSIVRRALRYTFPKPVVVGPPLILWGLTLGVVTDYLHLLPPHDALEMWSYPTFTSWDVRFAVWAMTYRLRNMKQGEQDKVDSVKTLPPTSPALDISAVTSMLDGYYPLVRQAVAAAMCMRAGVAAGIVTLMLFRARSK